MTSSETPEANQDTDGGSAQVGGNKPKMDVLAQYSMSLTARANEHAISRAQKVNQLFSLDRCVYTTPYISPQ